MKLFNFPKKYTAQSVLTPGQELKAFIELKWQDVYKNISTQDLKNIYVFSFYVNDYDDDPRKPTLTIGFNTIRHWKEKIMDASDEAEAKWNYAFWIQNSLSELGMDDDKIGKNLIQKWINFLDLNYSDADEEKDYNSCCFKGQKITQNFIDLLIDVVQGIHKTESFEIPILIHELEYYDTIIERNEVANGKKKVSEFSNWLEGLCQ